MLIAIAEATAANNIHRSIFVVNNKNINQRQPGEKKPGKFHYNPGNMSEKPIKSRKDELEREADTDRIPSGHEHQRRTKEQR
jgi:hypothetical protein